MIMSGEMQFILSLCIVFTVVIGGIKFSKIDTSYYPFFYLATISLVVEIIGFILKRKGMNDAGIAMVNVFCYVEFFFYTWLFHAWGLFNFRKNNFIAITGLFFIIWAGLNIYEGNIATSDSYFKIIYPVTLLFFAVTTFNKFVIQDREPIFKNPKFWILIGILIFFTFYILIQASNISLLGKTTSNAFRRSLHGIVVYTNLIVNLMFAIGALCLPRKKNFTTPF
jgi:hypothetical protein